MRLKGSNQEWSLPFFFFLVATKQNPDREGGFRFCQSIDVTIPKPSLTVGVLLVE